MCVKARVGEESLNKFRVLRIEMESIESTHNEFVVFGAAMEVCNRS